MGILVPARDRYYADWGMRPDPRCRPLHLWAWRESLEVHGWAQGGSSPFNNNTDTDDTTTFTLPAHSGARPDVTTRSGLPLRDVLKRSGG